jgi:hypothetical protein
MNQVGENRGKEETVIYSMVPLLFGENTECHYPFIYNDRLEVGMNPCLLDEKDLKPSELIRSIE